MLRRKINILTVAMIAIFSLTSCVKEKFDGSDSVRNVLVVYIGGDNNLSGETFGKIAAIQKGWNGDPSNRIIIYQDPSNGTPALYEVVRGKNGNDRELLREYEEENSASPVVFARVIGEVKSLYPSASYGLLLFSHASGWLPNETLTSPKSVVIDGKNEMDIKDFAQAIPDGGFKYIVFEACFMSGIEVAYELSTKADHLLVSSAEIVSPGFTEVYPTSINYLLTGQLENFAQKAFGYFNDQSGYMKSATFSIVKTSQLAPLAEWLRANIDKTKTVDISSIQHFDRYTYRLFFDFEDYFSNLLNTQAQKDELTRLVNKVVVWKASTESFMPSQNGFQINKHSGLTTYIKQDQFPFMNAEYTKLKWYKKVLE